MTLAAFPQNLVGLAYPVGRSPMWRTIPQRSVSGLETRLQLWTSPLYRYSAKFDVLRTTLGDFQTVLGFINSVGGSAQVFTFTDPDDYTVTAQGFGVGDAVTIAWQLVRALGSFIEPVSIITSALIYRNDWRGNTLLSASARTNRCLQSQTANAAPWSQFAATVVSDGAAAPDGTTTADALTENTANSTHGQLQGAVNIVAAGNTITFSRYVKVGAGSQRWIRLQALDPGGGAVGYFYAIFNINTGVLTDSGAALAGVFTSASITSLGSGWYRLSVTGKVDLVSTTAQVQTLLQNGPLAANQSYIGDGSSSLVWGAQLEVAAAATSYIVTVAAAVAVTDYSISTSGLVTFGQTPASGALLTWTGAYSWPCRFDNDVNDLENFASTFYRTGVLPFTTVRLVSQ